MLTVVIPCKNQDYIVNLTIKKFQNMKVAPDKILVINDNSDIFNIKENDFVKVINTSNYNVSGRASARNLGIATALEMGSDQLVFIDGDSIPSDDNFIEKYKEEFNQRDNQLLIGLRKHVDKIGYSGVNLYSGKMTKYPSDYLTANQDNFSLGLQPVPDDLREVSKMNVYFNNAATFNDKADLMLSGLVMWTCNFAIDKVALSNVINQNYKVFDRLFYFDDVQFTKWGYEDIAFGLDALFADVNVKFVNVHTHHLMHNRSDELFTHIEGKSIIYNRYRTLLLNKLGINK